MVTGQPDWKRYAAIDVYEQTIGMYLIRDWSAKLAFYKTWLFGRDAPAGEFSSSTLYTVPTGKTLFLTDSIYSIYFAGSFGETSIWLATQIGDAVFSSELTGNMRCIHYPFSRSQPGTEGQKLIALWSNTSAQTLRLVWNIFAYEASPPKRIREYEVDERSMYEQGMFNVANIEVDERGRMKLRMWNELARQSIEASGRWRRDGKLEIGSRKRFTTRWWG